MGSTAHVLVHGGAPTLLRDARARLAQLEACWSRFQATSELSRMNAAAGRPTTVSADLWLLVTLAVSAWERTGGAFDPTVLAAVIAAGYDGDFASLPAQRPMTTAPGPARGCGSIELDAGSRSVALPAGVGLDPGGIGKGLAADVVVGELLAAGADGALVSLGGDVRVAGDPPDSDAWTVAVDHPLGAGDLFSVGLEDGAVATSSVLRRRWVVGAEPRHHLIDPRTGTSAAGNLVAASAVAGEGWWAEALATAALLGRMPRAAGYVVTVDADGRLAGDTWLLERAA